MRRGIQVRNAIPRVLGDDVSAGRAAAERLCHDWPDVSWIEDAPSSAWASAAIVRLTELMREQPAIFRASREGSERGAESLSPRPFQGVLEALQNADDEAATEMRLAVRRRGRGRQLLIVHNGNRVQLSHVGAMILPWVTTKSDDPSASGRFGIGQKTLRSLGGPIEIHCAPFRFRMEQHGPLPCDDLEAIPGVYDPARHETLVLVPLVPAVDLDELTGFLEELGSESLLFLKNVKRLTLVNPRTGARIVDHHLETTRRTDVPLEISDETLAGVRLELREPRKRQRYLRYMVERPLKWNEKRQHKEAGPTTSLGIAVSLSSADAGRLYDRLPLPIRLASPFSLNAQFDPDTARSDLLQLKWNEHRLEDLGELVVAAAADAFTRDVKVAWKLVPLAREVPQASHWLEEHIRQSIINGAQQSLAQRLQLEIDGEPCKPSDLVYEERTLDGLLTAHDQEKLIPGRTAVPLELRDREGRWREVLSELGRSSQLSTERALDILDWNDDELGEREPTWFVEMARAAIEGDLLEDLLSKRSILLANGQRVEPPGHSDPQSLVRRVVDGSLAAVLGVAVPIYPAYLLQTASANRVADALKNAGVLLDECDSTDGVLQVLARDHDENTTGCIRLEDGQLISLRDAFEGLADERQKEIGPRVGANIELRGFEFDASGHKREAWASPIDAYLPPAIDRETDSFGRAANKAPGILWLDSSYARVLKRTGGRKELGAQRFLSRLGVSMAPRLARPTDEKQLWMRDPRPASFVAGVDRPELQMLEIRATLPFRTHLLGDRVSPDIDTVIRHIGEDGDSKRRRRRALGLLAVMARGWERYYADFQHASAVNAADGYWLNPVEVTSTWLARAATEAWLPSATGLIRAPADLCLSTAQTKLAYPDNKGIFLSKVDDHILNSPVIKALRIRTGPSASSLVSRLKELRDEPVTTDVEQEARVAYSLLALACPADGRTRPVDDMSIAELRRAFAGGGGGKPGLLLIDRQWCSPRDVFSGPAIFGKHRRFAPNTPTLTPLWKVLGLSEPEAGDCIGVLREVARGPLTSGDKAVVMETMRVLAKRAEGLSSQLRAQLARLPLWTSTGWMRSRPVFALENDDLAQQVAQHVAVWQSGFSSFVDLGGLLQALGVTVLRKEDFALVATDRASVAGDDIRRRFVLAVSHLRDELAQGDKGLHDSISVKWEDLGAAELVVTDEVKLEARVNGRRIKATATAHVLHKPLTIVVNSWEAVGTAHDGGRAIATLFSGDRQKVAWAWRSMWERAEEGIAPAGILLPGSEKDDGDGFHRLIQLKEQATSRHSKTRSVSQKAAAASQGGTGSISGRPLKDISALEPDVGTIVNQGQTRRGVIFPIPQPSTGSGASSGKPAASGRGQSSSGTPTRNVLPPMTEREQLALDAVQKALRLDPEQITDLRARHGIGADAMDVLRQFYEMKMVSSAEFPSEVTLEPSQVKAAQEQPDFFLAVVCGLEEASGELRVRFIFDPLNRLARQIRGHVTLSGVDAVEALEYRFTKT